MPEQLDISRQLLGRESMKQTLLLLDEAASNIGTSKASATLLASKEAAKLQLQKPSSRKVTSAIKNGESS